MANKLRTVYFEDLSVGDILAIFGSDEFCDARMHYLRFGNDLRATWEALVKNEGHYETLCETLGLEQDHDPTWAKMTEALRPYIKKTITNTQIKGRITTYFDEDWVKTEETEGTQKAKDEEFKTFVEALFNHLKSIVDGNKNLWGFDLKRRTRKKAKK